MGTTRRAAHSEDQPVNRGSAIHTATADCAAFDSGIVSPGGRFAFRATTPGTFAYRCRVHPGMRGTVTVVGRSSPSHAVVAPAAKGAGPPIVPQQHGAP